jgi:tetratricopeptide (TPR) repeat protein
MSGAGGMSDLDRASALSDAGDHLAALALVDQVLALEPGLVAAHVARGWALESLGPEHLLDAREAYAEAVRLDPEALWAKEGFANVLRRLGRSAEADALAAEVVSQALALPERDTEVLELQGWCEYELDRLVDAEGTFRRALDLDPDLVAVRFDLALVLLCAGRAAEAVEAYGDGLADARRLGGVAGLVRTALEDLDAALARRPEIRGQPVANAVRQRLHAFEGPASSTGEAVPMGAP